MKRNKGFTLIEIVVAMSLLVAIGVSTFIGIRFVNNKIKITKLEQITDKAIEAAQIYIETNKEANNQLYNNQNGVSLPLKLLYDKGLLSLDNTDLTVNDLDDEYVVTFLGGSGENDNCEQITSSASWANNQPVYLCMNSTGTGSNFAFIKPTDNLGKASQNPYYFTGLAPDNYAKVSGNSNTYRIVSINRDDSITLFREDSTSIYCNSFDKLNDKYVAKTNSNNSRNATYIRIYKKCIYGRNDEEISIGGKVCNNENNLTPHIYYNTTTCRETTSYNGDWEYNIHLEDGGWIGSGAVTYLKPCVKITGGNGTEINPFILDGSSCT